MPALAAQEVAADEAGLESAWSFAPGTLDIDRGYLQFRAVLEPGPSYLLKVESSSDDSSSAGFWCTETTPATQFLSRPNLLLTSSGLIGEEALHELCATARPSDSDSPDPVADVRRMLERVLEPALLVRGHDTSAALVSSRCERPVRNDLVDDLLTALKLKASDRGLRSVVLPYVDSEDSELASALERAGFSPGVAHATTVTDVRGFDDHKAFVMGLRRKRRTMVRRELRRFEEAGLAIRDLDPGQHSLEVARLEAATRRKYGAQIEPEDLAPAKAAQVRFLPRKIGLKGCYDGDGQLVATLLSCTHRETYYCFTFGCLPEWSRRGAIYPMLTSYAPVQEALAQDLQTVSLGFESYEAKVRRGARIRSRTSWVWCESPQDQLRVDAWLEAISRASTQSLARLDELAERSWAA